jgi:hypothetical protein
MTPEARLFKAFELSQFSKDLFLQGLSKRYPDLPVNDLKKLFLKYIEKCHNRNY